MNVEDNDGGECGDLLKESTREMRQMRMVSQRSADKRTAEKRTQRVSESWFSFLFLDFSEGEMI